MVLYCHCSLKLEQSGTVISIWMLCPLAAVTIWISSWIAQWCDALLWYWLDGQKFIYNHDLDGAADPSGSLSKIIWQRFSMSFDSRIKLARRLSTSSSFGWNQHFHHQWRSGRCLWGWQFQCQIWSTYLYTWHMLNILWWSFLWHLKEILLASFIIFTYSPHIG